MKVFDMIVKRYALPHLLTELRNYEMFPSVSATGPVWHGQVGYFGRPRYLRKAIK